MVAAPRCWDGAPSAHVNPTVGGVNCACTHAHVKLQKKVGGSWTTVDTEYINL